MKRLLVLTALAIALGTLAGDVRGRGGFSGGGGRSFSGAGGGSYSGGHSYSGASGFDRGGASGSYDHSYTNDRGGSISTSGDRSAYAGPRGAAASSSRDTTVTTAGGKTYTADSSKAAATGWRGNTVAGREGTATGPGGSASWNSAFAGNRYTGNAAHYSSFNATGAAHSTSYWSAGYMHTQGGYVRGGFGYYGCFHAGWYTAHPGCWMAAGWAAGAAWNVATWPMLGGYCGITAAPIDYDYGTSVAITNNNVYMDGQDQGTVEQYATAATNLATQGQASAAAPSEEWKPLGVFALAQGDDKTSNNIFQLAINKDGIIRGNYYDGLMDTTTEVYGAVNKEKQLAAWTIGKKKDRVFEAGIYNLTQDECPCLVHAGTDKTIQMMLVRIPPKTGDKP